MPVVRKTGGLIDTVFDVDHDVERAEQKGLDVNGYSFEGADASGMDYALNRYSLELINYIYYSSTINEYKII